jgi:para-aminobenzoate synthetase / 4-amino-4-deoxychorismate lyase
MEENSSVIHDAERRQYLMFRRPLRVIRADKVESVLPALKQAEDLVNSQGLWAAGWISYEAGPAFDSSLVVKHDDSFPFLWFGLYEAPETFRLPPAQNGNFALSLAWEPSITEQTYNSSIARIKGCIERGETYQVNFTYRLKTPFSADPWEYFLTLAQAQDSSYCAFVDIEDWAICSASPELFFRLDGNSLVSLPMKGTAARGLQPDEDLRQARLLHASRKDRAENVMIVDMVRNDMSRVAETGSVRVPKLFAVEKYPTVWQMTSTVCAETRASVVEIMQALFPASSITGAPKKRTMEIIADLETTPRRVYTGCVGFFGPNRKAQFNVAIRTVLVDKSRGRAEYGVGGGIVWDSTDHGEFEECRTKTQVLTRRIPKFSLLESLLWTPEEGYFLLSHHLSRLQKSVEYFSFAVDMGRIRDEIFALAGSFVPEPHKARLAVDKSGKITFGSEPLSRSAVSPAPRVCLAPWPVNSTDPFLYHKTTNRKVYNDALAACPGFDEVILWNENEEITESCVANIIVEMGGELFTPPVRCGLLPGTFRAWLLDQGEVKERVILKSDLSRADKIYLVNSVRKMREAVVDL